MLSLGATAAAQPLPQGVVIQPEPTTLELEVRTDKAHYLPGERLRVRVRLGAEAHVYLYAIHAGGKLTLLVPNAYTPDEPLAAGEHLFPDARLSFVVDGPPGTETIVAIASPVPLEVLSLAEAAPSAQAPFAPLGDQPAAFAARLQELLAASVPPTAWAVAWTTFQIERPSPGRWLVRSRPAGAQLGVNGEVVGSTPLALLLAWPERAGERRDVSLALHADGYQAWVGTLRLEVTPQGTLRARLIEAGPRARLVLEGESYVLEVALNPAVRPAGSAVAGTGALPRPPGEARGRPTLAFGVNLGTHPQGLSTFGLEVGLAPLLFGLALADTGQAVPAFFDLGEPADLGPEIVYNEGPQVEIYFKLALPLKKLCLELGAGLVRQSQVHLAVPSSARAQDVEVLPNGYRTERLGVAGVVGLALELDVVRLQLGYDTHRGPVLGLGIAF